MAAFHLGLFLHRHTGLVVEDHDIGTDRHHVAESIPQFIRNGLATVHIRVVSLCCQFYLARCLDIPLDFDVSHSLGKGAGIRGRVVLIAVGRFCLEHNIASRRARLDGAVVLHAGRDGLGHIDFRGLRGPEEACQFAKVVESLVIGIGVLRPGRQHDVAIARLRGLQIAKTGCRFLVIAQIDQRGKIRHARLDGRCLLDAARCCAVNRFPCQIPAHGNLCSVELHIVRRVDLAQHADGAAGIERDERTAILDGIEMLLSGLSCIKNAFQRFIIRFAGQGCRSRCHDIEGPRIDDAALADGHAVRAQEEEIAADFPVLDGVQRAIDVNASIDEVQEVVCTDRLALLVEVQVGNMVGVQLEFLKLIDGNLVVAFLCVDIVDTFIRRCIRLFIGICDI